MAVDITGMTEKAYLPKADSRNPPHVKSMEEYRQLHKQADKNPEEFWKSIAEDFYWRTPPKVFLRYNFDVSKGPIQIKWMDGAITNICYNALDRNIERGLGDNVAFYWEGNDPRDSLAITYKKLHEEVCKFANVLKKKGLKKGDRVAIYMPMILELPIAMLACARIGVIHSVVFAGYSAASLAGRIQDATCSVLIYADGVFRGTKLIDLKSIADEAVSMCRLKGHKLKSIISVIYLKKIAEEIKPLKDGEVKRLSDSLARDLKIEMKHGDETFWQYELAAVRNVCDPEWMDGEDPLFVLYTSGSTGKPKGILHTTAGYMLYSATTFKYVFDYHPKDIYFCTADIGWITGHTYVVYGPLLCGATSVLFEGIPFHPHPGRYWEVIEKYKVNKFYTAPTAIRALMRFGDACVKQFDRSSLEILGTVGEPINPEAWLWYYNIVGDAKCSIVDTFWQTETGGHVITPLPRCTPTKPGSATFPFFGVSPHILDEEGKEIKGPGEGYLVFKKPWPGIMRTIYNNHERFEMAYFTKFPGYYCTGDGARRDKDGYYWVTGRIDDMLNCSGHLLSTAQVESALLDHDAVIEAAAVSYPHALKGECLYCFVVLKPGSVYGKRLETELKEKVRQLIGPFATPEYIHASNALPKTRSGKILRRVLRKIARNDRDLGDLTSLSEPKVVDDLFKSRGNVPIVELA